MHLMINSFFLNWPMLSKLTRNIRIKKVHTSTIWLVKIVYAFYVPHLRLREILLGLTFVSSSAHVMLYDTMIYIIDLRDGF